MISFFCKFISFIQGQGYSDTLNDEVTARKVCETLQTTLGTVISKIDYPLGEFKCKEEVYFYS